MWPKNSLGHQKLEEVKDFTLEPTEGFLYFIS